MTGKSNTDRVWEAMEDMLNGSGSLKMTTTYGDTIDSTLLPGPDPDTMIVVDNNQVLDGTPIRSPLDVEQARPAPRRQKKATPAGVATPPPRRPSPRRGWRSFVLAIMATAAAMALAVFLSGSDLTPDPNVICSSIFSGENGQCKTLWLYVYRGQPSGEGNCLTGHNANCVRLTTRDRAPEWVVENRNTAAAPVTGGQPALEWPWPYVEGEIIREPMPLWQLSLELAACGNHLPNWPRTCYSEFMNGLAIRLIGCFLIAWGVFWLTLRLIDGWTQ